MRKLFIIIALMLLGISGITQAAEYRIYGNPVVIREGTLWLGYASILGKIYLYDGTGNYAAIQPGAMDSNDLYTWFTDFPSASGYLATCSNAGVLSWTDPATIGAPDDASYLTLALNAGLSAERVLTAGSGISLADTGANGTLTVNAVVKLDTISVKPANDAHCFAVTALDSTTNPAIYGSNASTTAGTKAIHGEQTGATGATIGVRGEVTSADNAAYGGSFDRTNAGAWVDVAEGAAPADPPSGYGRVWADTADLFYTNDASADSCMTLWSRAAGVISPATANDSLHVPTNMSVAITGESNNTSGIGVNGWHGHATGLGYGIKGITGSSNNDAYGGYFNQIYLGIYADIPEAAAPAAPSLNKARVYAIDGLRAGSQLMMKDSDGVVHDLTSQGTQVFPVAALGGHAMYSTGVSTAIMVDWTEDIPPITAGVLSAAGMTCTAAATFLDDDGTAVPPDTYGNALLLSTAYGAWTWTSTYAPPGPPNGVWKQGVLVVGTPLWFFPGDGGTTACKTARASVRLKVNDTTRFNGIKLTLHDSAGTPVLSSYTITPTTSFANYTGGWVDASSFTGPVRMTLTAYGTNNSANVGATEIDVESFAIEWRAK